MKSFRYLFFLYLTASTVLDAQVNESSLVRSENAAVKEAPATVGEFPYFSSEKDTYASPFPHNQPTNCDKNYDKLIKRFSKENPKMTQGGIVMLGDSIAEAFPVKRAPKEWNLISRGIGGDGIGGGTYKGLLNRLHISCHELKPSKVFLKIGINDLYLVKQGATPHTDHDTRLKAYEQVLVEIKKYNPEAQIYVASVLPLITMSKWGEQAKFDETNDKIVAWNKQIEQLANQYNATYVDLHQSFLKNGKMNKKYVSDGIHLNASGYEVWMKELEKIFR